MKSGADNGALLRDADAISGQDAGQRMHEDGLDAERVGDAAGVLTAGAAEARQRKLRDIVAALNGYLLDRTGHVIYSDAQKTRSQLESVQTGLPRGCDLPAKAGESRLDGTGIDRLIGCRPEHAGKVV